MAKQTGDFHIYAAGICYASACTSLSAEEATERINLEMPSGVSPWAVAGEPFRTGESNPHACPDAPETHRHFLFSC